MKRLILLTLLCLLTLPAMSQHTKRVRATGSATGTDVHELRKQALYDAKRNALREAGVPEAVSSFSTVYVSSDATAVSSNNATAELSLLMLDGQVRLHGEPEYKQPTFSSDMTLITVSVSIKADVVVEDLSDPEFRIKVEGIKDIYREGESLQLSVTPYRDCYLRIFWFDQTPRAAIEGDQLFPFPKKYADLPFSRESTYQFPKLPKEYLLGNPLKIEVFKQTPAQMETCLLFVVALKKQIPYDRQICNYEQLVNWLLEIPANERTVFYQPFNIVK